MALDTIHHRYKVLGILGEGAMGRVCLVEDLKTGDQQAMKVVTAEGMSARSLLQFKQEFRLMTQLRHPHCCEVYEYGLLPDGRPYFTMELVPGHGLNELLPLPAPRVREVLGQVLLALDSVHQLGLVHRDLKAANVRVKPDGTVKLMDYGLMEYAGRSGGQIAGTLAYLSPEVIKRSPVDLRADLYSLGVLGYELLTGRTPFLGDKPIEVLRAHLGEAPMPPSLLKEHGDPALEAVVMRLLEKDPIDRYQGAFQVLDDLGLAVPVGLGGSLLTSPLMGRAPEIAMFSERLTHILQGRSAGALALYGPSGIGKTRLLEEFRFMAQLENIPLAEAACYEQGGAPYDLVQQVLRSLLPELRAHQPALVARHAPALVKLLPELDVPRAPELDANSEKLRLQTAVTELVVAFAERQGLVLLLDDWQWADPLSRALFEHLMPSAREARILFLLASRYPPEGGPAWMAGVTAHPLATLNAAGVKRMVVSMLGSPDVSPRFISQVAALSEGSPFFVERLLEHLVLSGAIQLVQGRWKTDVALGPEAVPPKLQTLLIDKLSTLPDTAQLVARVGALRGRVFGLDFLQRATGLEDEALFAALDALVLRQVFVASDDGSYRFAQDHFPEFLYAHLAGDERLRLHQRVAEALEDEIAGRHLQTAPLALVAGVAHHAQQAAMTNHTIVYGLAAAIRHAGLYALSEAERLLKAGLAVLKRANDPRYDPDKLQHLYQLGMVRRELGHTLAAKQAYQEALPMAEAAGDEALTARILSGLGACHRQLGSWPEAITVCQRALTIFVARQEGSEAAQCLLTTSRAHLFNGDAGQAIAHGERALAFAREAQDPRWLGEALAYVGNLLLSYDATRAAEGMAYFHQSLAILPEIGDQSGLHNALLLLGNSQATLGDYPAARESFTRCLAISEAIGNPSGALAARVNLGTLALEQGEFKRAEALGKETYDQALRTQSTYMLGVSMLIEAVAAAHLGVPSSGLAQLNQVLDLARDLKHRYLEAMARQWIGEVHLLAGSLDAALAAAEALSALIGEDAVTEPQCRLYASLAEIHTRRGDLPMAAASYERAMAAATGNGGEGSQVRALKARAHHALAAESWKAAMRAGERGLAIAHRIDARYQAAQLRGLCGEAALALGNGQAALHFAEMVTLADEIGSDLLKAEALFGLAAAHPYHSNAPAHARVAQDLLMGLAKGLGAEARAMFLATKERTRILAGNYIEFSLSRAIHRSTGSLMGPSPDQW